MKIVTYLLAAILAALGLIFVTGAQGSMVRLLIGALLLVAAGAIVYLFRSKPQVTQSTVVQQIDLSGDVSLETLKCKVCGAPLAKDSLEIKAGAVFVACAHCGASYQLEEEPKW
jgi:Zn finger protein HypA/HybF involved in hydrogenase expression